MKRTWSTYARHIAIRGQPPNTQKEG